LLDSVNFGRLKIPENHDVPYGLKICPKYWRGEEGGEGEDFSDVAADHKNSHFNFWKKL
jgi:hypothetical protein